MQYDGYLASRRASLCVRSAKISSIPFLSDRDPRFLRILAANFEVELYSKGGEILKEGVHSDKLFFLFRGTALLVRGGSEVRELKEGSIFGEMSIFGPRTPPSAAISALEFCDCRVITRDRFQAVLRRFPQEKKHIKAALTMSLLGDCSGTSPACSPRSSFSRGRGLLRSSTCAIGAVSPGEWEMTCRNFARHLYASEPNYGSECSQSTTGGDSPPRLLLENEIVKSNAWGTGGDSDSERMSDGERGRSSSPEFWPQEGRKYLKALFMDVERERQTGRVGATPSDPQVLEKPGNKEIRDDGIMKSVSCGWGDDLQLELRSDTGSERSCSPEARDRRGVARSSELHEEKSPKSSGMSLCLPEINVERRSRASALIVKMRAVNDAIRKRSQTESLSLPSSPTSKRPEHMFVRGRRNTSLL